MSRNYLGICAGAICEKHWPTSGLTDRPKSCRGMNVYQGAKLHGDGMKKAAIARAAGINRSSVYRILDYAEEDILKL